VLKPQDGVGGDGKNKEKFTPKPSYAPTVISSYVWFYEW